MEEPGQGLEPVDDRDSLGEMFWTLLLVFSFIGFFRVPSKGQKGRGLRPGPA